ncbi:heparanase-like protein 2 [Daucus carota subsp. sativus]|uniref:heparanase-like protein 2 n=1 Tax=Daucus carota subsp. sativus TaxID=79200 RepID=UPI0007EFB9A7|nr:PREDICTED: heparanase-like protein 2 isoform X1 [Daucus carota subsp. sativus]XP_017216714.1 PREDICTED: heparanase-like protein 2 isoform X2 [Daucus carota subsp. sativus]
MSSMKTFALCVFFTWASFCMSERVELNIRSVTSVAKTDEDFICATIDLWPSTKCDYNQCPWPKVGLLELDLKNKVFANAIKAFDPLRIRIGGSLEDQTVYKIGLVTKCPHFKNKMNVRRFGFSNGCITMERWDELNHLFNETGAKVTFSLNALRGRKLEKKNSTLWVGDWNKINAQEFMKYTISKGYKIDSYELGNELSASGVSAKVKARQYGKDMIVLSNLVKRLYANSSYQPKLLGPAGFYDQDWFNEFLQVSGPGIVHGLTHHIYNLGPGVDANLINKVQDPYFLDEIAQTFKDVSESVKLYGPWSGAWVGESGGAYNSGGKHVSNTFANGFWYLDQLGMSSTFDHKVYCRQALIGGNYGLLNTTTFAPNPDYYGALLWHRLMGTRVLQVSHDGSPYLRSYAHCSKHSKRGDITVLLINMSNSTTFIVNTRNDLNLYPSERTVRLPPREEYHLTPEDGNIQSEVVLLNDTPLKLTKSMDIPNLNPAFASPLDPIKVAPDSFVFAVLRGFDAPACSSS